MTLKQMRLRRRRTRALLDRLRTFYQLNSENLGRLFREMPADIFLAVRPTHLIRRPYGELFAGQPRRWPRVVH